MVAVVNHFRLSGISAVLIIVNADPGCGGLVIHKEIIADPEGTNLAFHEASYIMGRKLGYNACVKTKESRAHCHIQLCASHLLDKGIASGQTLVIRGRQPKSTCPNVRRSKFLPFVSTISYLLFK